MKKQTIFIVLVFTVLSIKFAFSQIKETSYLGNNKVVTLIDTTNYENWKITRLTYFFESDKIKKKEEGFIKQKPKEDFFIYKKETLYFETGQRSHEFVLNNNLKDSIETFWYENGQKYSITRWAKGKKQGRYISWHQNGDLFITENYKNDTIIGESISYASKGIQERHNQFFSINKYRNGNIASSESYRHDGSLKEETVYNDTARTTKFYYKSGSLKKKDIVKNPEYLYEEKNSTEEYYREDGTLKMIIITKNGKITINDYDENGKYIDWNNEDERRKRLLKE